MKERQNIRGRRAKRELKRLLSRIKRLFPLTLAGVMLMMLTACGETGAAEIETPRDSGTGSTVTAQVSAVEGSTFTLLLGELSDMPDGGGAAMPDGETPPELPGGEGGAPEIDGGATPEGGAGADGERPDIPGGKGGGADTAGGDAPSGMPGGAPFTPGEETLTLDLSEAEISKGLESATIGDIAVGDILTIKLNADGTAKSAEILSFGMGGGFGGRDGTQSSGSAAGTAAETLTEDGDYSDTLYASTGDDENALLIDGAAATLSGVTVNKSAGASSNAENGDFYGINAAVLATNGAYVSIKDSTISSSAQNGNGIFSYGSGTVVNVSNTSITTAADNSGGIQTTGGGTTNASDLTVETSGSSSAAIRSDRGGGTVNVDGGSYTTNGYNSPAVYSTADITVENAILTANNSEALVIEGKNSIILENCQVSGSMSDTGGSSSDENVHNVMIYQSMSGDADVGTSLLSMRGGTLTANNGDMFYITNTSCVMTLSGVELNCFEGAYLMNICGNSASHGWGEAGSNGAQVQLTTDGQTLAGDIAVDSISTLELTLKGASSFTGTVNITDNAAGGAAVENNAVISVESGCTWTLTGDCTISSLANNGTINYNGFTITLADGTVLS